MSSTESRVWDVAIVGAGAAGLATAAFLARFSPSASMALIEGARKPGAKILVSGGSRCNVTNVTVSERDFWGGSPASIRQVLRRFTVGDTRAFFTGIGVPLHEEERGKLFPDSNRSRDVLDALLREVDRPGVQLLSGTRVTAIAPADGRFVIDTSAGRITAHRVVLATGGRALPKSGSDGAGYALAERLGHTIAGTTPALAPLLIDPSEPLHNALSGVAHPAELSVWVNGRLEERLAGPLLWTHFGVSGPVALNASRVWAQAVLGGHEAAITVSMFPGLGFDEIDATLQALARERPRASAATLLATMLPLSVAEALLDACAITRSVVAAQIHRDGRRRLAHALAAWPLRVSDTRGYTYAEATAGGVSLRDINPQTMESRVCPGVLLVGEILDVDGRLGGYNFQWAWSSAWVAAEALAGSIERAP